MKISIEITCSHKSELFVMYLSFIGWIILATLPTIAASFLPFSSIISFVFLLVSFIPYLYLAPYMLTSFTYAYHYLKQDAINRKVLTHADFGEEEPVPAIESPTVEKAVIEDSASEELTTEKPTNGG